jgi:serine/threonine protein phosphatase PrpC
MRFDWGAASDPGRVRPANEDAAVAEDGLFAVADGMGGHAAGEIASRVAVEALRTSAGDGLVEAVRVANRAVLDRAAEDPALRGMGTTMCALALVEGEPPQVLVVNVGDSRAYLYRDGELQQLTDDHNLVAELEREGRITREEALVHPQRNIITRVLGNDPDVEVDEFPVDVFRGDRFLICSDGLFNEVRDDAIADVLRTKKGPQEAADELVRRANAGGGRDNISVVVVDVVDDDGRAKRASAALAGSASKTISPPAGTVTGTIEEPITDRDRLSARDERVEVVPEGRRRKLTVRSAAFTLALLVVAVAAVGSVWWFARNTFYVGVDDGEVTIFRGRPGGVLWLEPTVEQRTGLEVGDLAPARQEDVRAGKDEATLSDARSYVATLRRSTTTTTTSTTTTTTSSVPSFTPLPPTSAP